MPPYNPDVSTPGDWDTSTYNLSGDKSSAPSASGQADEELLQEIRDNYRYGVDMWKEARDERKIDMRYLSGDPWEPEDRKARADAGRPCINHDELNQYTNQAINSVRQNKRGVKIEPAGNGANDKTAEFRHNLVRAIEYRSKAQSIYSTAFQQEIEGGYGFCRVSRKYVDNKTNNQQIIIKPIANPDSVIYDPDCKEADWSDAQWCFVLDPMPRKQFERKYPKAQLKDFSEEETRVAQDWIHDKTVLVAEYWKVENTSTYDDDLEREIETKTLWQYLTNGIEILSKTQQLGEELPIIPFVGMERWIDDAGAKRKLYSLVRLARDPQMSHAYLCSQQMEEAGLSPKTPYVGYKGQFESDEEAWRLATKVPHAYLQVDPVPDAATGGVLPLPRREQFTPNFQGYEVAKDSTRRAIQAAMGISPLPTAAQRQNEKSGVALERIQTEQAIGSFHFVDGYERAVERVGRVIESWISGTYDYTGEVALRAPDDTHKVVQINTPAPYVDPATQEPQHFPVGDESHDVTISIGPSNESQREAASEFLDTLIGELGKLPVAPPQAAKLLALAIQMKQLGPKGDEMAEIISPSDNGQQAQQQAQEAMQKAQQMGLVIQEMQKELQQLQMEKQARVIDNQYKLQIEQMKIEADITRAEITTKAQMATERFKWEQDAYLQLHGQAHEVGMQAVDQAHEKDLAQHQAEAAQQEQAAQQTTAESGDSSGEEQ